MKEIYVLFVVLVVLYTVIAVADQISIQCGIYTPLFAATFVGFLLGDLQTGLIIGATLQLMTLGVATYGGATVPDYLSGAIMGTTYAIIFGEGAEYGIALAIPIGLLLTRWISWEECATLSSSTMRTAVQRRGITGELRGQTCWDSSPGPCPV